LLVCSVQDTYYNVMQTNKSKNQKTQIPSIEGRAAELQFSKILHVLDVFFDTSSFDHNEALLADLLQAYVSPDPDSILSNETIANTIHSVRTLSNLVRTLETLTIKLKGELPC
jgi:hypothetical protein